MPITNIEYYKNKDDSIKAFMEQLNFEGFNNLIYVSDAEIWAKIDYMDWINREKEE